MSKFTPTPSPRGYAGQRACPSPACMPHPELLIAPATMTTTLDATNFQGTDQIYSSLSIYRPPNLKYFKTLVKLQLEVFLKQQPTTLADRLF